MCANNSYGELEHSSVWGLRFLKHLEAVRGFKKRKIMDPSFRSDSCTATRQEEKTKNDDAVCIKKKLRDRGLKK